MLHSRNLDDKSFEELMEEAIGQISLYSREWTNYNPSDPGITILENLTAFAAVQRQQLNTVTRQQREKLLKLAGVEPEEESAARVLLQAPASAEGTKLRTGEKFLSEGTCFEAARVREVPGKILEVWAEHEGKRRSCTPQLCGEMPVSELVFGSQPKTGDCIYLAVSSLPSGESPRIHFYVETEGRFPRNPWEKIPKDWFAEIDWSICTQEGYRAVSHVWDDTGAFLRSGEITLELGECEPALSREFGKTGYVLRGVLTKADYDIPPRLLSVHGLLFPVYQRDTLAFMRQYAGEETVEIYPAFPEKPCLFVYGREQEEEEYYAYEEAEDQEGKESSYAWKAEDQEGKESSYAWKAEDQEGKESSYAWEEDQEGKKRCYVRESRPDGSLILHFPKKPWDVRVVCCCEAFMQIRKLGQIYGYERQSMPLYGTGHIEEDSLMVMTERRDLEGNLRYQFFRQKETEADKLCFRCETDTRKIILENFGPYEGAWLYLCRLALFQGEEGNARRNNQFQREKEPFSEAFTNPAMGRGGRFRESLESMEQRLSRELRKPVSAVTARDYEELVKHIPGLCIHKVKAVFDQRKNKVYVMVKPYQEEKQPALTARYQQRIFQYLEKRRMLTVQVVVRGPVYVPVDVKAAIVVKRHYDNGEAQIRCLLERELDFVEDDRGFGSTLYFNQVFRKLQELPCVEYVEELSLLPVLKKAVVIDGLDIRMNQDALCCPGRIDLELEQNCSRR